MTHFFFGIMQQLGLRENLFLLRHRLRITVRRYPNQAGRGRPFILPGVMIMTGDVMFCPFNLDLNLPPGNADTTEIGNATIARLYLLIRPNEI